MKKIQFISVQELKDSSIVQTNVDEKILSQCITEFQELELQQVLGKATYKRLSNVLVSGATISGYTYSDEDTLLFDVIKPVMVYGSLLYSISPLHYKLTNKGVQNITDDNAKTGDGRDLESLKSNYTTKLEGYKRFLIEHLETDEDPETEAPCSTDTTFAITGISIPDNSFNEEEAYRASAYKTGYYRRIIY
ncbi:hypothetical protein DYU05_15330 [Mucilaginibacter terrenus]|uniref:Uncharacterized protein n=1 Tax=Mucilaginibacter terrenus TaxID=2482727 RepID=A0A3E2NM75_9SPHI|nr:hypothetical protein [Mucilaginibacter terrenus]RFZ82000.1 hypothetical protein DYU05_15330 [Mucilaginibacter terrenus]